MPERDTKTKKMSKPIWRLTVNIIDAGQAWKMCTSIVVGGAGLFIGSRIFSFARSATIITAGSVERSSRTMRMAIGCAVVGKGSSYRVLGTVGESDRLLFTVSRVNHGSRY